MKATGTCPKCRGRRLLVQEKVGFEYGEYRPPARVKHLPVAVREEPQGALESLFGVRMIREFGAFESWTCLGCGFTELYAVGLDEVLRSGVGREIPG